MTYAPPYKEYVTDGTTTRFVFDFELEKPKDIQVYFTPPGQKANEKEDLIPSDLYTVTISPLPKLGGHIDIKTPTPGAPAQGGHLVLRRSMVLDNPTSFEDVETFDGKALDLALKRLLLMVQENNFDASDRALHYPTNAKNLLGQETELPILGNNQFWKKVNGVITAVTIDDDPDSLRSELASKTQTAPGAALVGFYAKGETPAETTVDAKLKTLISQVAAIRNGTDSTMEVAWINKWFPVGSGYITSNTSQVPPGQGVGGITWVAQTAAEGHILMGSSTTGAWTVAEGAAGGTAQTCDPMTMANLIAHTHTYDSGFHGGESNDGTGADPNKKNAATTTTSSTGSATPTGIGLTTLQRYGVTVWRRTA